MNTQDKLVGKTITVIDKYGYQNLSLRKLTATLGLTTGAFYKHFKSKDALYEKVAIELSRNFIDKISLPDNATAQEKLLIIAKNFCQYVDQHNNCLLYTSDAADDGESVDLGGRRIIKKKNNVFKNIFLAFRGGRTYNYFVNVLLTSIFTGLWSLLFIIPGIVKSYSYAMTFYILEDMHKAGKEVGVTEAITKSRQMMKGHKFQLFVLDLSFIGWGILATLALGIGWLWLVPYIQTTKAEFYRKLAANN